MPSNPKARLRHARYYLRTLPERLKLRVLLAYLYASIRYRKIRARYLSWRADRLRRQALLMESEQYVADGGEIDD